MWHIYILECDNGTLYTGIAKDPDKRFREHLKGRGAAYTRMHKPVKIIYRKRVGSISRALKREKAIKSWPRPKKLKLVAGTG